MEKKTILFVIESLHCGGAEKSLVTLLANLDYSKYQVDLLMIKRGGEFEKFVPKEVTVLYDDSLDKIKPIKRVIAKIKFGIGRKLLNNKKYNTAHLFWEAYNKSISAVDKVYDYAIGYSQGFATYFVADKVKANKKLAWLNTDYLKAKHYPKYDYAKYAKLDKVVCVSKDCETSLIQAMDFIDKKLSTNVIKDITDDSLVKELSKEEEGFFKVEGEIKVLTVCRLVKLKGLHLAIDACRILVDSGINVKWFIIGEGTEREFLEKRIADNNIEKNLILMGFKENPYPYMYTTDIYVQTSLFEGLGLTVIEAVVLKKLIVTTNFPTASSILEHTETGLICEMDPSDIANSILQYIENPDMATKVISNLSKLENNDKEISLTSFNRLLNKAVV